MNTNGEPYLEKVSNNSILRTADQEWSIGAYRKVTILLKHIFANNLTAMSDHCKKQERDLKQWTF